MTQAQLKYTPKSEYIPKYSLTGTLCKPSDLELRLREKIEEQNVSILRDIMEDVRYDLETSKWLAVGEDIKEQQFAAAFVTFEKKGKRYRAVVSSETYYGNKTHYGHLFLTHGISQVVQEITEDTQHQYGIYWGKPELSRIFLPIILCVNERNKLLSKIKKAQECLSEPKEDY